MRRTFAFVFAFVVITAASCRERATVELPRVAEERPAERPVVPDLPPAPPPPVVPPLTPPVTKPAPVATAPAAPSVRGDARCYVLVVSGDSARVAGAIACPAGK